MKILSLALVLAGVLVVACIFQKNTIAIINWINTLGVLAPVFFIFIYCLASLLFLPTMVFTLAGGALFGPIHGVFFNITGATLGAAIAFFISRYWIADWVLHLENERVNKLINGVEQRGWQFIALLRVIPITPFSIVNYGLGLTRIKFTHYLLTTCIFLIPAEIISTYSGYAGMQYILGSDKAQKGGWLLFLVGLGCLVLAWKLLKRPT